MLLDRARRCLPRAVASLLVAWLGSTVVPAASAQGRVLIGALTDSWGPTPQIEGMRDGLAALGYRDNIDFVIGVRFTRGDPDALPQAARELVRHGARIIFTSDALAAKAAKIAADRVPIVFAGGGDPVLLGLIQSLARPGGRVTGVTDLGLQLAPKRLEILREMVPSLRRVLFVYNAADDHAVEEARRYREAAGRLGVVLVERRVRTQEEASAAFARIGRGEVDGILQPRFLSLNIPGFILEISLKRSIPAMFSGAFWVERGALVSYGGDFYDSGRQAARLVDKILRGADPGQIPVETNPKVELAINVSTARAMGVAIPREILYRANRVVE